DAGDAMGQLASIAAGGTLTLRGGRELFTPGLTNSGTIAIGTSAGLAGVLTITGDYAQTPDATFEIEIKGRTAGVDFGHLTASGAIALDGRLSVKTGNFVPAAADQFTIVSGASRSGTFAVVAGTVLPGVVLEPEYDADRVRLLATRTDLVTWDG